MKKAFLLFCLIVHFTYGQDKPYHQLEQKLAVAKSDSNRLEILNHLVDIAFGSDIQKALEYAKQGVLLSDKINDINWQPRFYEMEGRMYANLLKLDSATIYFDKAMSGYIRVNNIRGQATTLFKISWVYKKKGQPELGLNADLKALSLMEKLNDKAGITNAYERISGDLTNQERLSEATVYAQKAIEISEKNNLEKELVYALTNAGSVEIAKGNDSRALEYFNRTLQLAERLKFDRIPIVDFLNNRGNALKHLGRYKEALKDYQTGLTTAKETNYTNAIAATIANLGEVNLLMGNYKDALKYQLETIELQENQHDLSNITENYLHISNTYEHLGDFESALSYHKKALIVRDHIASVKSDTAMSRMLAQFENKKKEATILSQQKEISQQQKVQLLGIGIVLLLVAFIIFGIITYLIRVKRSRLLAIKNSENELLLKEIHHRVKNNLEMVSSLLALQSAQIDDPNTKEAMLEGQNRVHSISIVHQKLYQGKNPGTIEMKDYFLNLGETILDSFGAEERVKIELAMENLHLDIDTAVPLGLIVNELLTNTIKYAFPNQQSGNVRIKLQKQTNGILHLEVSDNGIGKTNIIHGTGFGSQLISLLTIQLDGKMHEKIQNGTSTFFDFKLFKLA